MALPSGVNQSNFDAADYLARNPGVASAPANALPNSNPNHGGPVRDHPDAHAMAWYHFSHGGYEEGRPWRVLPAAQQQTGTTTGGTQQTGGTQTGGTTQTPAGSSFFDTKINLPVVGEVPIVTAGIGALAIYFLFFND